MRLWRRADATYSGPSTPLVRIQDFAVNMKFSRRFVTSLRALKAQLRCLVVAMLRSPQMTSYTGFGMNSLATGQFGAIGRGRLVRIAKIAPDPVEDSSSELSVERDWGWI